MNRDAHRDARGYTLVELMVVLAVGAVLTAVGVPSLRGFMAQRGVQANVGAFAASLRLARHEAVQRGLPVSVCHRQASALACETSTARRDWAAGWLVFVDRNGDGIVDAPGTAGGGAEGDLVLLSQPADTSGASILAGGATRYFISFRPSGIAVSAANNLRFLPALPAATGAYVAATRRACISFSGGLRVTTEDAC